MIKLIPVFDTSLDDTVLLCSNAISYFYLNYDGLTVVVMNNGETIFTNTPFNEFYENLMGRPFEGWDNL